MLDVFYALTGLDLMGGNTDVQKALVDADDGTVDGNLRARVFSSDPNPDDVHAIPPGGTTTDHRRGDGYATPRDFRAFRDAFLQVRSVEDANLGNLVMLDGSATHFKRDLNMDGCLRARADACDPSTNPCVPANPPHPVDIPVPTNCSANIGAPVENVYPRYDFNGDGRITANAVNPGSGDVAPFKIDPATSCTGLGGGCLRDIDVMAQVWEGLPASLPPENQPVARQHYIENVGNDSGDENNDPLQCDSTWRWQPRRYLLADRNSDQKIDYLYSVDLHFSGAALPSSGAPSILISVKSQMRDGNGQDDDGDGMIDEQYDRSFTRRIRIPASEWASQRLMLTVPIYSLVAQDPPPPDQLGRIRVSVKGVSVQPSCWEYFPLHYGQDVAVPPRQGVDPATPCPSSSTWAIHLGGSSDWLYKILTLPDGGYLAVGGTYTMAGGIPPDMWVFRLGSDGNVVWAKAYGDPQFAGVYFGRYDGATTAAQISPSEYVIVGGTHMPETQSSNLWVMKINIDNGDVIWSKIISSEGALFYIFCTQDRCPTPPPGGIPF